MELQACKFIGIIYTTLSNDKELPVFFNLHCHVLDVYQCSVSYSCPFHPSLGDNGIAAAGAAALAEALQHNNSLQELR